MRRTLVPLSLSLGTFAAIVIACGDDNPSSAPRPVTDGAPSTADVATDALSDGASPNPQPVSVYCQVLYEIEKVCVGQPGACYLPNCAAYESIFSEAYKTSFLTCLQENPGCFAGGVFPSEVATCGIKKLAATAPTAQMKLVAEHFCQVCSTEADAGADCAKTFFDETDSGLYSPIAVGIQSYPDAMLQELDTACIRSDVLNAPSTTCGDAFSECALKTIGTKNLAPCKDAGN